MLQNLSSAAVVYAALRVNTGLMYYVMHRFPKTGLPLPGKKFWKMKNFPGQGKVRELHFQSGKFKKMKKVMEKSGNFKIFLKRC